MGGSIAGDDDDGCGVAVGDGNPWRADIALLSGCKEDPRVDVCAVERGPVPSQCAGQWARTATKMEPRVI